MKRIGKIDIHNDIQYNSDWIAEKAAEINRFAMAGEFAYCATLVSQLDQLSQLMRGKLRDLDSAITQGQTTEGINER